MPVRGGPKEWSPRISDFLVVSGNVGEDLAESDLIAVPAASMDEAMKRAEDADSHGADVVWIFEKTDEFAAFDPEKADYFPIPGWKLVRTV